MMNIYNEKKLTPSLLAGRTALVVGGGAVGSHLVEWLTREGCSMVVVDSQKVDHDNLSKSSLLLKDGVGHPKARVLEQNIRPYLRPGQRVKGVVTDVRRLGPGVLSQFDAVFLALDNDASRMYLDGVILSLPPMQRPILINCGTFQDTYSSILCDMQTCSLADTIAEKDVKRNIITSCTEPQAADPIQGDQSTVGVNASLKAALLGIDHFKSHLKKNIQGGERIYCGSDPCKVMVSGLVTKGSSCTELLPVDRGLTDGLHDKGVGNTLHTSLGQLFADLRDILGEQEGFELIVPTIRFKGEQYNIYRHAHGCLRCGKPVMLASHNSVLTPTKLLCTDCAGGDGSPFAPVGSAGDFRAFSSRFAPHELMDKRLSELGFRLGEIYELFVTRGTDKEEFVYFTLSGDRKALWHTDCL